MIDICEKCGISNNEGTTQVTQHSLWICLKLYQIKFHPKSVEKDFVAHRSSVENCHRFTFTSCPLLLSSSKVYRMKFHLTSVEKVFVAYRSSVENRYRFTFTKAKTKLSKKLIHGLYFLGNVTVGYRRYESGSVHSV